ncbi:MAG: helix-turn-helix transcriptional regulator [Bacillota bacterium]
MAERANSKLKLLYLMKILEQTDEENTLTVPQMIEKLSGYGICAERKSIYDDIDILRRIGMDIVSRKTRTHNYFVGSRLFELPELKLLVDAVQCSKFITHRKSNELIKKLESLTSREQAKKLARQVYVIGRVKSMNESIYYNVDEIFRAILSDRQICFKYYEYTANKRMQFRRQGEVYCVSPYMLSWYDENYYLVAYHERYGSLAHFRVDKMAQLTVTEQPRKEQDKNLNAAEYAKRVFGMFTGEQESVRVVFDASLIGVVIDRFGRDVVLSPAGDGHFAASLNVQVSPVFLAWLFQFGDKVKIESPGSVAEKMKELAAAVCALYE